MAIFRLDFRPLFRAHGKRDRDAFANAVAAAVASSPGRGGTAAKAIHRLTVKAKRWGYVIPISQIGQKLWWLLHGATRKRQGRQPARPVTYDDAAPAEALAQELQEQAAALVARYDREAR